MTTLSSQRPPVSFSPVSEHSICAIAQAGVMAWNDYWTVLGCLSYAGHACVEANSHVPGLGSPINPVRLWPGGTALPKHWLILSRPSHVANLHVLPAGAVMVIVMIFMAVTSSGASEMLAVSSLFTFDIYRRYINPKVSQTPPENNGRGQLLLSSCHLHDARGAVGCGGVRAFRVSCVSYIRSA